MGTRVSLLAYLQTCRCTPLTRLCFLQVRVASAPQQPAYLGNWSEKQHCKGARITMGRRALWRPTG